MINKSMERALQKGEAIAVDEIGEKVTDFPKEFGVVYKLPDTSDYGREYEIKPNVKITDIDLCIKSEEAWIWSVGIDVYGAVYASTTANFYQHKDFTCIWLR